MEKEVAKRQHFEGKITCLQSLQRDTLEKYNRCLQDIYILEKTNKENESLIQILQKDLKMNIEQNAQQAKDLASSEILQENLKKHYDEAKAQQELDQE